MPTGSVSALGNWHPGWWRRTFSPNGRNYVTRELTRRLPWAVAHVMGNVSDGSVKESDVLITINQTHPDSTNAKDISIRLEIGDRHSDKRDDIREAFEIVVNEILADLCSSRTGRPTVDVDIFFVNRTGLSLDTRGVRTNNW